MALTAQDMVLRVKQRTAQPNDLKIIGELASAKDWAYNKIFISADGPDQLSSSDVEVTLSLRTREWDMGAASGISGTDIYGIKLLWLKFPSETVFSPMRPADSADLRFIFNDQWTSADTTTVATGHPVMYDVIDFAKVRFAPPLPSGSVIRVDYWLNPPNPNPNTNNQLLYGDDIMAPTHEAITDKATAQIFVGIDDNRVLYWEQQAMLRLRDALYVIGKRTQGATTIQPFRIRRKRWI